MKLPHKSFLLLPLFVTWALCTSPLMAAWQESQTFALNLGWNAIYLEVQPDSSDPNEVFATAPIDRVVAYFPNLTPVSYIQDPDEAVWKTAGWHKWVPPSDPSAFLNTLYDIQAGTAYLVRSTEAVEWSISGAPRLYTPRWVPDSFNLTGFPVGTDAPPSFANWFADTPAFDDAVVFQLENNRWQQVSTSTAIEKGAAYWVYCRGGSDYSGPLSLTLYPIGTEGITYPAKSYRSRLRIVNRTALPINYWLENLTTATLPLQRMTSSADGRSYSEALNSAGGELLEPGERRDLTLIVRRDQLAGGVVEGALRLTHDLGAQLSIPVRVEP